MLLTQGYIPMTPYKEGNDGYFSDFLNTDELDHFTGFPGGLGYDFPQTSSPLREHGRLPATSINMHPMSPVGIFYEEHNPVVFPFEEGGEQIP